MKGATEPAEGMENTVLQKIGRDLPWIAAIFLSFLLITFVFDYLGPLLFGSIPDLQTPRELVMMLSMMMLFRVLRRAESLSDRWIRVYGAVVLGNILSSLAIYGIQTLRVW